MILAHKIALDPNDKQRSYFRRASGTARFAYNWALGEWRRQYQAGEKPSRNLGRHRACPFHVAQRSALVECVTSN
jgi:hypothetical protein